MPDDLTKPPGTTDQPTDQPVIQVPEPPKEEPITPLVPGTETPPTQPPPSEPPPEVPPAKEPPPSAPHSPPPAEEPPIVISAPPKKSRVKVIMASIVGLLILASIPAGVYLVQQRQEIRKRAGTGSECFEPPQLYRPAPYEYHLGDTHSPESSGDWVVYRIKEPCANPQRLSEIFGPLDRLFNKEVYITRPNQSDQYGFTFNRIMHIDGYDDAQIQSGNPALTEQQLHNIHMAGKDKQSIRDCDKNGRQVIFDLTGEDSFGKIAKPNGWTAWETGYYQFDLTPKFRCEGSALHQGSLGAGFIRVVSGVTPMPTPTPTPTPPPDTAQCEFCKAYDTDWNEITDLSTLTIGQTVYFATRGSTTHAQGITKARFRITIDGVVGSWQETTQKHDNKFYIEYTIPSAGSYTVESMVYNPVLGWW